jgi:hypothetical protein
MASVKSKGRKLLAATIGVATVNIAAGCFPLVGNLMPCRTTDCSNTSPYDSGSSEREDAAVRDAGERDASPDAGDEDAGEDGGPNDAGDDDGGTPDGG